MSSSDFLKGLMYQDSFSEHSQEEVPDYENGIRKFGCTYNMISHEQKSYLDRDQMIANQDHIMGRLLPAPILNSLGNENRET